MSFFEVKNLSKNFGGLAAVSDVCFQVNAGEIFGLIGPNGSGKTTLFNLISSYIKSTSGKVWFKGKDITHLKTHKICHLGIGRTFQIVKPLGRLTVLENVMVAAFTRATSKTHAREIAREALDFCDLAHRSDSLADSLPIGERKRLEITRAMATKPELLLLDETAAGLNPAESKAAVELMLKIRAAGITIIIVEHIMKVIMTISDRVHAINFGKTITEGPPQTVAGHPDVIKAYLGDDYA